MRARMLLAALIAGLAFVSTGEAQFFGGGAGTSKATRSVLNNNQPSAGSIISGGFRLRDIFSPFQAPNDGLARPVSYTTIPNPNTPEYLQAFGYRPLR